MKPPFQCTGRSAAIAALLFACTQIAPAQDLRRLLPAPAEAESWKLELPEGSPRPGEPGGAEALIDELLGIDLVADPDWTGPAGDAAVVFHGFEPPRPQRLREHLVAFVGPPMTEGSLVAIADTVVGHYQKQGIPAVEVLVPEQEVSSGRIALVVIPGRVSAVALGGGAHFDTARIARRMAISSGDPLTMAALQTELDWLDRNRFHQARLEVQPGDGLAEADLLFSLSDERPLRVFGGFDNAGVEVVGEERWLAGFEWGNVFGRGHRLLYQATLGADIEAFRAHALDYRVPLPWRHELGLQAAVARSEVSFEDGLGSAGTSYVLAALYAIPLRRRGDLRHELGLGFEFKSTNNNLEFGGSEVFDTAAESAHFIGRYLATLSRERATTSFSGTLAFSPGELTAANDDESFSGIRTGAESRYTALRGAIRHRRSLPGKSSLLLRAGGQWTDALLLPAEQLALGGYDVVRGYPERDVLGDLGYRASAELRSPPIDLPLARDSRLQLLTFVDYGRVWAQGDSAGSKELSSAGAGLRLVLAERSALRFDYGWALDGSGGMAHIGMGVDF